MRHSDERISKWVTCDVPTDERSRSRPRRRWEDCVKGNITGVRFGQWPEVFRE